MNDNHAFYNFLGLGARGRKFVFGAQGVSDAIKSKKAKLVLIDKSASDNTKKDIQNSCSYYNVKCIITDEENRLGISVGKPNCKLAGIICADFAKVALNKYKHNPRGENIE